MKGGVRVILSSCTSTQFPNCKSGPVHTSNFCRVFGVFGVGENQLPGKVVVGANNIYHVGKVTILPLRFSAWSLFFSAGPNFHCQTKSKSFLLNLTLPSVTPSWIASLSPTSFPESLQSRTSSLRSLLRMA